MNNELTFFNMGKLEHNKNIFKIMINNEFGIVEEELEKVVSGYRFIFDDESAGYIEVNFVDNGHQLITIFKGDYAWDVIEIYKAFANRFFDED